MTDVSEVVSSRLSRFGSRSRVICFCSQKGLFFPMNAIRCKSTEGEHAMDIASDTIPLMQCNWILCGGRLPKKSTGRTLPPIKCRWRNAIEYFRWYLSPVCDGAQKLQTRYEYISPRNEQVFSHTHKRVNEGLHSQTHKP